VTQNINNRGVEDGGWSAAASRAGRASQALSPSAQHHAKSARARTYSRIRFNHFTELAGRGDSAILHRTQRAAIKLVIFGSPVRRELTLTFRDSFYTISPIGHLDHFLHHFSLPVGQATIVIVIALQML
jgi:hypothetical protein